MSGRPIGKVPASLFYWGDFVRDPDLRRCTNAEVGVWIRILCLMYEAEFKGMLATNGVRWTDDEIARAVGGNPTEVKRAVTELVTKGVASRAENGALVNRRMYREHSERVGARERMRKHREAMKAEQFGFGDVTANETDCSETEEENTLFKEELTKNTIAREEISPEEIYDAYPRKVARGQAMKAIKTAARRLVVGSPKMPAMGPSEALRWLWKRATDYALSPSGERPGGPDDYRPYPATWFNGERYFDDDSEWSKTNGGDANGNGRSRTKTGGAAKVDLNLEALKQAAHASGDYDPGRAHTQDDRVLPQPGDREGHVR